MTALPRRPVGYWRRSGNRAGCGAPRPAGGAGWGRRAKRCCGRAVTGRVWSSARWPCCPLMPGGCGRRWRRRRAATGRGRRSMPWSEAMTPVRMRRVAVVVPRAALRAALVRIAEEGCVELDRAEESAPGAAAARLQRVRGRAAGPRSAAPAALAGAAPDLDLLERRGSVSLLAGEVELEERAGPPWARVRPSRWPGGARPPRCPGRAAAGRGGRGAAAAAVAARHRPADPAAAAPDRVLHPAGHDVRHPGVRGPRSVVARRAHVCRDVRDHVR
ncbi:hypothetical protein GPN2_14074 [Streptomyces murinus]